MAYKLNTKLIDYLPEFLRNFKEFNYIFNSEEVELKYLSNQLQLLENNLFLKTADSNTLKKYEELFDLIVEPTMTLQQRRGRLISFINAYPPFSYNWFVQQLDTICDEDNYELNYDRENYHVVVYLQYIASAQYNTVKNLLEYYLPCNLTYEVIIKKTLETDQKIYLSSLTKVRKEIK